jgi:hypothetical protein
MNGPHLSCLLLFVSAVLAPGCSGSGAPSAALSNAVDAADAPPAPLTQRDAALDPTAASGRAVKTGPTARAERPASRSSAKPRDAGAPSRLRVEGVCVGEVGDSEEGSQCARVDAGGACQHEQHSPCDGWQDEASCEENPGCRWELRKVTPSPSGVRCVGEPDPCERPIGRCLAGCTLSYVEGPYWRQQVCEGVPIACERFNAFEGCTRQLGCSWQ